MSKDDLGLPKLRLARVIATVLAPATAACPLAVQAQAEAQPNIIERVIVTATRRANAVQDIPINITAITGDAIEQQRLIGLDEISRVVPGLTMLDRGARDELPDLLVRGLNTSELGPRFTGGTVATYYGEIPLTADFSTNDMERIEVLMGPQGTLYGSGTLGGAVRYIPVKPQTQEFESRISGGMFTLDEGDGVGSEAGLMLNVPLIDDKLAFRASLDYMDDPGYIDYPYVIREPGVSLTQPDLTDPAAVAANLRRVEDLNFEERLSGRLGLRYMPTDGIDATLWYYYQDVETGGRSINNVEAFGTGRYESGYRYEEPADIKRDLIGLEIIADLGFAELTSATGVSTFDLLGQRDQTDLILNFEYYYETFPSFSIFTREIDKTDIFTQELRLVSTGAGRWGWIVGGFYSDQDRDFESREFAPNFDEWTLTPEFESIVGFNGLQPRPDELEYIEIAKSDFNETALFGELSYEFSDTWQATLGVRAYEFEERLIAGSEVPLFWTVYFGFPQDFLDVELADSSTDDSGTLFKFNLSHEFSSDLLGYLTVSEGYRVGGVNAVTPCTQEDLDNPLQATCALPDELLIEADETLNYELGLHSTLLDGRLSINAAIYHIDWDNVQVDDVTVNGNLNIISNGGEASSDGLEFSAQWRAGERWTVAGTYGYTKAELATGTDAILGSRESGSLFTPAGSRLPGSPEHAASLGLTYSHQLSAGRFLDVNYGVSYVGDILNSVGAEQFPELLPYHGEKIPSHTLHRFSVGVSADRWSATVYVDNLLDEYYYTSTRSSQRLIEANRNYLDVPTNVPGFLLRGYGRYVGRPRTAGVSFSFDF